MLNLIHRIQSLISSICQVPSIRTLIQPQESQVGPLVSRVTGTSRVRPMPLLKMKKSDIAHTLTGQPTGRRALGPRRPIRQLAVDGTFHDTGRVHLPFPLQAQLQENKPTWFECLGDRSRPTTASETLTSRQNFRSTDLPSLRTQSSMRVLMPLPHTALSLS